MTGGFPTQRPMACACHGASKHCSYNKTVPKISLCLFLIIYHMTYSWGCNLMLLSAISLLRRSTNHDMRSLDLQKYCKGYHCPTFTKWNTTIMPNFLIARESNCAFKTIKRPRRLNGWFSALLIKCDPILWRYLSKVLVKQHTNV